MEDEEKKPWKNDSPDGEGEGSAMEEVDITGLPNPADIEECSNELNYLKKAFKNLKDDFEKINGEYVRCLADSDNYRKRINREKEESLKFSNEKLIRSLLPVLDNLELAITHAEPFTLKDESGNFKSFISGVEYARDEFLKTLKGYGVTIVETGGKAFDPNFHEVVDIVENEEGEDHAILEEKRKGYVFKGRLLRPAMVKILKKKKPSS